MKIRALRRRHNARLWVVFRYTLRVEGLPPIHRAVRARSARQAFIRLDPAWKGKMVMVDYAPCL